MPIVGTSPEAIHLAEERGAFGRVLAEAGLPAPKHGLATSYAEAQAIAAEIGYPVLVRPSYVLGGRGMEIVYGDDALEGYIGRATQVSPEHPVLVDRFIDDAVEIDVDALFDGDGPVPRRRDGAHRGGRASTPATRRARCRRSRWATRRSSGSARRRWRSPQGVGVRRAAQHPVRARRRHPLRARGQPACVADGAVRLQGHRHAAGQGRGPDHARRVHRLAARRPGSCRRPATAARCPPTSRSRSRRR